MKKTTKIILGVGLGIVAVAGTITGIYYFKKKKEDKNSGGENGNGGGSGNGNGGGSGNGNGSGSGNGNGGGSGNGNGSGGNIIVDNSGVEEVGGISKGNSNSSKTTSTIPPDILKKINKIGQYVLDNFEFKSKDDAKWYFPKLWQYRKEIKHNPDDVVIVPDDILGKALSKLGLVRYNGINTRLKPKQAFDIFFKYIPKSDNGTPFMAYKGGFDKPDLSTFPKAKLQELATNGYWFALLYAKEYGSRPMQRNAIGREYVKPQSSANGFITVKKGSRLLYACVLIDTTKTHGGTGTGVSMVQNKGKYTWAINYHF